MLSKEAARKLIAGTPWHHDFEIVPGVRTNGSYNAEHFWPTLKLPNDMTGLSLADVGASNGYFSFEARRRGAQVVAFDFRHKDNSGFGLAQHINGMHDIKHHQVNILTMEPQKYGQFDIVLCLGLLYHLADPYGGLANCAALARGRLLVESYFIDPLLPSRLASEPVMKFFCDPERAPAAACHNNDRSNFWGFTTVCLERMLEDLNFSVNRKKTHGDRILLDTTRRPVGDAATRLNIAYGLAPHTSPRANSDDPASWTII